MQIIILLILGIVFIIFEIREILLKNIKTIKSNKKNVEYIEYYREKIDDYSPLIYAKLLNKDITDSDVISSMILYLEEKNAIDIDKQNNIIIKKNNNLQKHELFFIEKSKFILSDLYNATKTRYKDDYSVIEELERLIYQDMIDNGLIDLKDKKSTLINRIKGEKYVAIVDAMPLFYDIVAIFILGSSANNYSTYINLTYYVTISISMILTYISILFRFQLETLKTEKGHACIEKIKAQKRFLKTYSLISDKTVEDRMIWEHYIRSAILLDLKGKLDKKSSEFYKNILNKYKYNGLEEVNRDKIVNILISMSMLLPWIFLFVVGDSLFKTILCAFIIVPLVYYILINRLQEI